MTTPLILMEIDILKLELIDRAALPGLPKSMEGRLLRGEGLEPCVILFHPKAALHIKIRLTDLDNLQKYIDELNATVLRAAMGETPEEEGYRI